MKILKISGKNLASLAGEFLVDFEQEPLASSGLFAISGPTGAGKSTLLDALCLALYDATPRLLKVMGRGSLLPDVGKETVSAQDTRTLLRRGSAEGYAEVDFVGNDGAAYRARWSVRRSRTKAEGILQATTMTLHQLPSLQAIGGTKTEVKFEIEQRIGLSFDQFTRAVLLAQNEFSTFLKTEDNERGELLETLTGSTIYSDISMRAFERAKKEKAALERLSDKLADQKPLDAEQRAQFDAQSIAADQALETLDAGKAMLEQQLRWHQESDQLQQQEELAQLGVQTSRLALDEAGPRKAALARIDLVQPARPLADAVRRIAQDIDGAQTALAAGEIAAAEAQLAEQASAAAVDQTSAALQGADNARRAAAPLLDQVKALDTRIETLLPAHAQARHAVAQADRDNDGARAALLAQTARQTQLSAAQQASELWLSGHQQWRTLALEWPRWDQLFTQAGQAAAQADSAAHDLATARRNLQDSGNAAAAAAHSLDAATLALQTLARQKQQALAALSEFDADALQLTRQQLEQRRAALADSGQTWSELAAKQARRAALAAQAAQLETALQAASASVQLEQARQAALAAALLQSERSLTSAEAACADSVETLRATLQDGAPCPVCGAEEHPYSSDDGALQAMLASLQAEVRRCRSEVRENIGALATHGATQAASTRQLALVADERQQLEQDIAMLAPRFHAQAQALGQPQPTDGAWLADASAAAQAGLAALQQQEQAWRAAGAARDRAQAAHDEKAAEQQRLAAVAANEKNRLIQLTAQQTALEEKRAAHAAQLAALLDDLDDAFRHAEFGAEDWKDNWRAGPDAFRTARQLESKQWLAQRTGHDERGNALQTIAAEVNAATATAAQAERQALAAHAAFAGGAATLATLQTQRGALWQGQQVADVERKLAGAIEQAQAALAARQQAQRHAGEQRARLDEALLQTTQRLAGLRANAITASDALEAWLKQLQHDHPASEIGEIGDSTALTTLLAIAPDTIRAERQALLALDQQAANAATVLAERQAQRQRNLDAAPPELASKPALADALAALLVQRKEAHEHATALKLAIAQDDARRHSAQAMLAEIDSQAAIERRWASLNDLIGSSDGKKFRNYAQQFTLDVLLGYANAHLNQLAKRYQLERIVNLATPSLGLMVRDQDMGGELRSVHSLSGGESFLVSLALALGLASLSSNRVRVESLFIDEGFGSLDSETLRVAMDALDGLQSMGRKVGVISHVQEMTDRIATKILVQPSAGGKSRVSVQ